MNRARQPGNAADDEPRSATTKDVEQAKLLERLDDPGFTPARRELPAMFALLGSADTTLRRRVERALSSIGGEIHAAALAQLPQASVPQRRGLVSLLGRVAASHPNVAITAELVARLSDGDEKTRRLAARALGNVAAPEAEAALLKAWNSASPELRQRLAQSLGKVGGRDALELLTRDDPSASSPLQKRARLMLARSVDRPESRIALDAPLGRVFRVVATCRRGLVPLLVDELGSTTKLAAATAAVSFPWSGSLRELLRARTALAFAVELPLGAGEPAAAIADAVTSPLALHVFERWTEGDAATFRLSFVEGGHRRSLVWRVAELVAERTQRVVNDPRRAAWEVRVSPRNVWLVPRRLDDPRFSYRVSDVPAASHPTIAAALARAAGTSASDVVWDPFCGSGLELIERGLLGPYAELIGSDTSQTALERARENFSRAELPRYRLVVGDARQFVPKGTTTIITNPPMGRRVESGRARSLLLDAMTNIAAARLRRLRFVWLSPFPEHTAERARSLGWHVERRGAVDLGGFDAELQLFRSGD